MDFEIKEVVCRSTNVITFELVTAEVRWFVVGFYNSPLDLDTLHHVQYAPEHMPATCRLLLLGDLNANLAVP